MRLKRQQTFRHGLQVLFGLRDKKFQDLVGNFRVLRQAVRIRIHRRRIRNRFSRACAFAAIFGVGLGFRVGRGRNGKRKSVALLERGDIADRLDSVGADLQQVEFKHGDGVGNEFRQRAVHVRGQRRVHGIVEDVRHFRGHF